MAIDHTNSTNTSSPASGPSPSNNAPTAPRTVRDSLRLPDDQNEARLRNRYIATRFVRFAEPGASLSNTDEVMRWARQLLDDEQPRLAVELLHLALQEEPAQRKIWLFLIELAFLGSDAVLFAELVELFKERFADKNDDVVHIIDAMGHDMAPLDPRYAHVRARGESMMVPNWSVPDSSERDEVRQKKMHRALVEAMMFHLSR